MCVCVYMYRHILLYIKYKTITKKSLIFIESNKIHHRLSIFRQLYLQLKKKIHIHYPVEINFD